MKQQQIRDACRFGLGVLVMLMTAAVLIWAMTSAHAQSRSRSFYDGRGSVCRQLDHPREFDEPLR